MQNSPLPHSVESEQQVLGGMILNPDIIPQVKLRLDLCDFYLEKHKEIFRAVLSCPVVDWASVWNEVDKNKVEKEYLFRIASVVAVSAGWEHHADTVKNLSKKRHIWRLGTTIRDQSIEQFSQVDELLAITKNEISEIEKNGIDKYQSNDSFYFALYNRLFEKEDPGLYTGIEGLEKSFWIEPGYIHGIASESNVGKSALMLQMADYIAENNRKIVLFYSLESTRQKIGYRLLCRHSRVALTRLNKCNFESDAQIEKIQVSIDKLSTSKLKIYDDTKYYEIERLISHVENQCIKYDVAAVFVDYLQAAQSIKRGLSKKDRVENTLYSLKRLAKDINKPVIFASQLRKDIQGRPSVDDLYESNEIRQATDNILFLYSPVPRKDRPVTYPVEIYLEKGKDQELFSIWQQFNGNFQEFTWIEKPTELLHKIKNKKSNWMDNV